MRYAELAGRGAGFHAGWESTLGFDENEVGKK